MLFKVRVTVGPAPSLQPSDGSFGVGQTKGLCPATQVQTKNSKYKPRKAMLDALDQLAEEVESINVQFTVS